MIVLQDVSTGEYLLALVLTLPIQRQGVPHHMPDTLVPVVPLYSRTTLSYQVETMESEKTARQQV
jgi:hypothetical protein